MEALIAAGLAAAGPLIGKIVASAMQGQLTPEQEAELDADLAEEMKQVRARVFQAAQRRDKLNAEIDAKAAEKFKGDGG